MAPQVALYAPPEYWAATDEVKNALTNGCGPSGWKISHRITDHLFLLDVKPACDIHDWMYIHGADYNDKAEADRVFLNNMQRLINAAGGWRWLMRLRHEKAWSYYVLVRDFGGVYFWFGKNEPETMGQVVLQLG